MKKSKVILILPILVMASKGLFSQTACTTRVDTSNQDEKTIGVIVPQTELPTHFMEIIETSPEKTAAVEEMHKEPTPAIIPEAADLDQIPVEKSVPIFDQFIDL